MIGLAALIAVGTIIESKYDATAASKLIYRTPWMYGILSALVVSLTAVMADRWPWQKKHIPFILAHIGIIVMLTGALITSLWGLDGSMVFPIGGKNRFVQVPETELTVWSSFDGDRYTKLFEQEVDFFLHPPTPEKPFKIGLGSDEIRITNYLDYAIASRRITESFLPKAGGALRFQMKNNMAEFNDWLLQKKEGQPESIPAGLSTVTLGEPTGVAEPANELFLWGKKEPLNYLIRYKDHRKSQKGTINVGGALQTGWMGLEFKLLQFFPKAQEKWDFKKLEAPTPLTTSAIEIEYQNQKSWIQLDDLLKLFTKDSVYLVSYGHRRVDIGFDVTLKDFKMETYQGTSRAAAYQSLVESPEGEVLISMNEPMKSQGLTFYQASFQQDQMGKPTHSVLSVNYDPGRFLKYLGSLVLSLGVIWLFYNRRQRKKVQ